MNTLWTRSKWSLEDLDLKTVEFRIPIRNGTVQGIGEFLVRGNPEGLLAVDVVTDAQGRDWAERVQTMYHIPQVGVDRIERHPDSSIAAFRLV